ncbi:MAG: PIG-L family deacetylase [Candidatus Omnitrophica bacterium]|nr:PIG-L family deacetylase [Candidatus Omnitrophota bacterium]
MDRFADAFKIREVVIIVAHADDESLGCGGYMPILKAQGKRVKIVVASDGIVKARGKDQENRISVHAACKTLGVDQKDVFFLDLEDQKFEKYYYADIVNKLKSLKMDPDLLITHGGSDLNNDHRFLNQCVLIYGRSVSRQINILGCEIPNSTEWSGKRFDARFYVDIDKTLRLKQKAFSCYKNEVRSFPHPWSMKGLEVLALQRGMEVGLKHAEAYEIIRWFA